MLSLDRYHEKLGKHIKVKPPTLKDIPDIVRAQRIVFPNDPSNYTEEQVARLLKSKSHRWLKATYKDEFAGFGVLVNRPFRPWTSADTLCVLDEFAGKCVGAYIMNEGLHAFGHRPFMKLTVRENNRAAIHLYERFGFKRVGQRRGHFADQATAIIMMSSTMR